MSQRSEWRRFVQRRRRELHDVYPCAMPTHRRRCPLHHTPIGTTTELCVECHAELLRRIAAEYTNEKEMTMNDETPTPAAAEIAGQLGPFDVDLPREHEDEIERLENVYVTDGASDDAA